MSTGEQEMIERLTQVTVIRDDRDFGAYQPGEIGKVRDGLWIICCPICHCLGELRNHHVAENQDGTITIEPSLVCNGSIYKSPHTYEPCHAHYFVARSLIRWV